MEYRALISKIMRAAPFESAEDARLALDASLSRFGLELPHRISSALAAALPKECAEPLASGRAAARDSPAGRATREPPAALQREQLERIQAVCGVLDEMLAPDLTGAMARELPEPLAAAFDGGAARRGAGSEAPRPRASTGVKSARHLSEARIGSVNSFASGRPEGAHRHSVADANPHGDTKLSSARGLTQERERETLASNSPERGRRA